MDSAKKGVLFDLDGVLVPTEALKAKAHSQAIRELGGSLSPELYQQVMGQSHEAASKAFLDAAGIRVDLEKYTPLYQQRYQDLLDTGLDANPGAVDLLQVLSAKKYSLAVVTSSSSKMLGQVLEQAGLARFFSTCISADDVSRKKPAPDAYLLALEQLSLGPMAAVVVEDSAPGVRAAHDAGIRCIAVRHTYNALHEFSLASSVFDSLKDYRAVVETIDSMIGSAK